MKQSSLDNLWSKAIKAVWKRCAICGATTNLQSHHIVARGHGILRHDISNGICVCVNLRGKETCHDFVHTRLGEKQVAKIIGDEKYQRLCKLERMTLNDYLKEMGLTRHEFREIQKNRIKAAMECAYKSQFESVGF